MNKLLGIIILTAIALFAPNISAVHAAPILKLHSSGHDVTVLQQLLQKENYTVNVTGIFDESTQKAVQDFQSGNNLPGTGIVDRQTWWILTGKKAAAIPAPAAKPQPAVVVPRINAGNALPPSGSTGIAKKPQSEESAIAAMRAQKVNETAPFLPGSKANSVIATAKKYMGTPYVYGGETPKGFDCSGYLQYVFKQNNIIIPRTADEQYKLGRKVPASQLQPGDLVFFATDLTEISHCGIYLGGGQFIHASSSKGVRIDRLDNSYWQKYFINGKHIVR